MKNKMIAIALIAFVGILASAKIDKKTPKQKVVFHVSGNCEMCKERLETALDVKGISFAEWDINSKMLTVVYNPAKLNLNQIHVIVSNAGHDTELYKAPDASYQKLHHCCKYRENPE